MHFGKCQVLTQSIVDGIFLWNHLTVKYEEGWFPLGLSYFGEWLWNVYGPEWCLPLYQAYYLFCHSLALSTECCPLLCFLHIVMIWNGFCQDYLLLAGHSVTIVYLTVNSYHRYNWCHRNWSSQFIQCSLQDAQLITALPSLWYLRELSDYV